MGGAETILLSPGFQVDVGVGLFGFVELRNGAATLRGARTTGQGITAAFQVELASAGQGLHGWRWNYRPESGITVFWQDGAGQIYRRSYDIQGKPLDAAPVRISGMTPLAWSASPLGEAGLQMVVRAPDGRYFFRGSDRGALQPPVALPEFAGATPTKEPEALFSTRARPRWWWRHQVKSGPPLSTKALPAPLSRPPKPPSLCSCTPSRPGAGPVG